MWKFGEKMTFFVLKTLYKHILTQVITISTIISKFGLKFDVKTFCKSRLKENARFKLVSYFKLLLIAISGQSPFNKLKFEKFRPLALFWYQYWHIWFILKFQMSFFGRNQGWKNHHKLVHLYPIRFFSAKKYSVWPFI